MFTEDDLDSLVNATGLSEAEIYSHPTLGLEYTECLRLQHSLGANGRLAISTMVDMIRRLGLSAPRRPAASIETNWREVKRGARVIVTPNPAKPEKKYSGAFEYIIEQGLLSILLDGCLSGADEFPKDRVQLAPLGVSLPVPAAPAPQPVVDEADEADAPPTTELVRGEADRADPEGRVRVPTMERNWFEVEAGTPLAYTKGNKVEVVEFIEEGPGDGEVSVRLNDQTVVVSEALLSTELPAPKPQKTASVAVSKRTPKKAAKK